MVGTRILIGTRRILLISWLAMSTVAAAQTSAPAELLAQEAVGSWEGTITEGLAPRFFRVEIQNQGPSLRGRFDYPARGYLGAELPHLRTEDNKVAFSIPLTFGALRCAGVIAGNRLAGNIQRVGMVNGEWKDVGAPGTFTLERSHGPTTRSYDIDQARFTSGNIELAGEVLQPRGGARSGVVLVHTAGKEPRDAVRYYADIFARNGMAALIYDKRGVNQSQGDSAQGDIRTLANDAIAGVQFLREKAKLQRVGLFGISEGGWVVVEAAAKSKQVSFLVTVSAPTMSWEENVDFQDRLWLTSEGVTGTDLKLAEELLRADMAFASGKITDREYQQLLAKDRPLPWFPAAEKRIMSKDDPDDLRREIANFSFDPKFDLSKLRLPAIWFFGSADKQVDAQASVKILDLLPKTTRRRFTIVSIPSADHLLQKTLADNAEGIAPEFENRLSEWLSLQHLSQPEPSQVRTSR